MTRTYAEGVEDAARALKAWEDWEAAVILDPSAWSDQYGFTVEGDNYDRYIELQDLRNAAIRTLSPSPSGIEDARDALTKAAEAFRMYERSHQEKALTGGGREAEKDRLRKSARNRNLAEMCESASSKIGGDHG